jgi:hypothetical protein
MTSVILVDATEIEYSLVCVGYFMVLCHLCVDFVMTEVFLT